MNTNGTQAGGSDRELFATYFSPAGRVTIAALVVTAALCTMDRMLLSLVVMTLLELDMIANEAHLGGFLGGIVLGAAVATISRVRRRLRRVA